jgi:hypothetical protein
MEAIGSSLPDALSTRVYVTDMSRHRPVANRGYEHAFGSDPPTNDRGRQSTQPDGQH